MTRSKRTDQQTKKRRSARTARTRRRPRRREPSHRRDAVRRKRRRKRKREMRKPGRVARRRMRSQSPRPRSQSLLHQVRTRRTETTMTMTTMVEMAEMMAMSTSQSTRMKKMKRVRKRSSLRLILRWSLPSTRTTAGGPANTGGIQEIRGSDRQILPPQVRQVLHQAEPHPIGPRPTGLPLQRAPTGPARTPRLQAQVNCGHC